MDAASLGDNVPPEPSLAISTKTITRNAIATGVCLDQARLDHSQEHSLPLKASSDPLSGEVHAMDAHHVDQRPANIPEDVQPLDQPPADEPTLRSRSVQEPHAELLPLEKPAEVEEPTEPLPDVLPHKQPAEDLTEPQTADEPPLELQKSQKANKPHVDQLPVDELHTLSRSVHVQQVELTKTQPISDQSHKVELPTVDQLEVDAIQGLPCVVASPERNNQTESECAAGAQVIEERSMQTQSLECLPDHDDLPIEQPLSEERSAEQCEESQSWEELVQEDFHQQVAMPDDEREPLTQSNASAIAISDTDISSSPLKPQKTVLRPPTGKRYQHYALALHDSPLPAPSQTSSPGKQKQDLNRMERIEQQQQPYTPLYKSRCEFWPGCTNNHCKYYHPFLNCRNGDHCSFGKKCTFLHPSDYIDFRQYKKYRQMKKKKKQPPADTSSILADKQPS
ncbi:hypothetical protein DM01DRAFT_1330842 [Hesseltinella vesiculosa]|uniref:C3H1-type domain-containing protein n=1 Tax=Hesseltinella vesiculosa TaxID=101127 RepID=A0A1X2GXC6_9FUNG|nr:hypothetical protein DM01DRAFT_1330842 [Hesseltinella vesiculosa]